MKMREKTKLKTIEEIPLEELECQNFDEYELIMDEHIKILQDTNA